MIKALKSNGSIQGKRQNHSDQLQHSDSGSIFIPSPQKFQLFYFPYSKTRQLCFKMSVLKKATFWLVSNTAGCNPHLTSIEIKTSRNIRLWQNDLGGENTRDLGGENTRDLGGENARDLGGENTRDLGGEKTREFTNIISSTKLGQN